MRRLTAMMASLFHKWRTQKTVRYGRDSLQKMTLYQPKSLQKSPVILYAHGGNWNAGDKSNVSAKPAFFTAMGWTFVSMNYRLAPSASYENMAEDIATATVWLNAHAEKLKLDLSDFHVMGHSAGGHLMALVSTNRRYFEQAGLRHQMIRSVTNIEGPLDLSAMMKKLSKHRDVFGENPTTWQAASPLTYAAQENLPPLLVIAHADDTDAAYFKVAEAAGNSVSYFEAKTTSHRNLTKFIATAKTEEAVALTAEIISFLTAHMTSNRN